MAYVRKDVIIEIKQGLPEVVHKDPSVRVIVRDFDVDGCHGEDLKVDKETGARYQELIWDVGDRGGIANDKKALNELIKHKYEKTGRLQRVFKRMKARQHKKEDRNVTYGKRVHRDS